MTSEVQVLGLCRFSYPAPIDSFQTRHKTLEDRKAMLYSPERLELRCFWFEQITLPSLLAQTDLDFTLLILFGDDFPEPYRSRILKLVEGVKQIKPVFRASAPHRDVYREIMQAERRFESRAVAEFRLDDDDAVAVNFVAQTRTRFRQVAPVFESAERMAMDFSRGVIISAKPEGVEFLPVITRFWAAGLVVFFKPENDRSVMDFPHQQIWKRMPAVSFNQSIMYLRGMHRTNDSKVRTKGNGRFILPEKELASKLRQRFRVEKDRFVTGVTPLL